MVNKQVLGHNPSKTNNRGKKRLELVAEALRISREQYVKFIEDFPVGISITSMDGRVIQCNKCLQELLGFQTKEEVLALFTPSQYLESSDRERFLDLISKGPVKNFEARVRRFDGTPIWVSISSLLQETEAGGKQIINIIHDINERKETEEELKLRVKLLDSSSDAIILRRADSKFSYINEAAAEMFGSNELEIGKPNLLRRLDDQRIYKGESYQNLSDKERHKVALSTLVSPLIKELYEDTLLKQIKKQNVVFDSIDPPPVIWANCS